MVLAMRALPDRNRPIGAVIEDAYKAHSIVGELHFARSLTRQANMQ